MARKVANGAVIPNGGTRCFNGFGSTTLVEAATAGPAPMTAARVLGGAASGPQAHGLLRDTCPR